MKIRFLLLLAILTLKTSIAASADYLLKIEGVDGESTDITHPKSIEIFSFAWGLSNPATISSTGSGISAGKAIFQDISIMKYVDKASPVLMQRCATGTHIPQAQIFVRRLTPDKPFEYYRITLSEVLITSVSNSGSSGSDRPMESISLAYKQIKVEYIGQKPDGSAEQPVVFNFDLALAK